MRRTFHTLDVFTDRPFAGNPLAVVTEAEGLTQDEMQTIAREFNLSETVFVLPPAEPRHRARLKIFTPGRELPFAGHPTVGTAVLLNLLDGGGARAFGLEEGVGIVPCVSESKGDEAGIARFRLPRLPEFQGDGAAPAMVAGAFGLSPREIGFDRHYPSRHSAGVAFDFVPVATREALGRVRPDPGAMGRICGDPGHPSFFLYTRETSDAGHQFRARMFAPGLGVSEDPATGSAVAGFAGVIMQFEKPRDGTHDLVIEQGYEMGRPSLIQLQIVVQGGALVGAEIGGGAVVVSRGTISA